MFLNDLQNYGIRNARSCEETSRGGRGLCLEQKKLEARRRLLKRARRPYGRQSHLSAASCVRRHTITRSRVAWPWRTGL